MSAQTQATPQVSALDKELNDTILKGDILGAFDRFYDENVSMQENNAEPFVGKALNREREVKFVESVEQFHSAKILNSAVNGNVTFSEWELDLTLKGPGRITLSQVAVRHWQDGKIVFERFYYKG